MPVEAEMAAADMAHAAEVHSTAAMEAASTAAVAARFGFGGRIHADAGHGDGGEGEGLERGHS
jgi:hypothetical protein